MNGLNLVKVGFCPHAAATARESFPERCQTARLLVHVCLVHFAQLFFSRLQRDGSSLWGNKNTHIHFSHVKKSGRWGGLISSKLDLGRTQQQKRERAAQINAKQVGFSSNFVKFMRWLIFPKQQKKCSGCEFAAHSRHHLNFSAQHELKMQPFLLAHCFGQCVLN